MGGGVEGESAKVSYTQKHDRYSNQHSTRQLKQNLQHQLFISIPNFHKSLHHKVTKGI